MNEALRLVECSCHDGLILLDLHGRDCDRQVVEHWKVCALFDHLNDLRLDESWDQSPQQVESEHLQARFSAFNDNRCECFEADTDAQGAHLAGDLRLTRHQADLQIAECDVWVGLQIEADGVGNLLFADRNCDRDSMSSGADSVVDLVNRRQYAWCGCRPGRWSGGRLRGCWRLLWRRLCPGALRRLGCGLSPCLWGALRRRRLRGALRRYLHRGLACRCPCWDGRERRARRPRIVRCFGRGEARGRGAAKWDTKEGAPGYCCYDDHESREERKLIVQFHFHSGWNSLPQERLPSCEYSVAVSEP
jgi:hypothetical protein